MTWFYEKDGKVYGPETASSLKRLAETGVIDANTIVRKGDDPRKFPAGKVKGLSELFQQPAASLKDGHKFPLLMFGLGLVGVVAFAGIGWIIVQMFSGPSTADELTTATADELTSEQEARKILEDALEEWTATGEPPRRDQAGVLPMSFYAKPPVGGSLTNSSYLLDYEIVSWKEGDLGPDGQTSTPLVLPKMDYLH